MNYLTLNRRNDNWSPLASFQREMDQLLEDFFLPRHLNSQRTEGNWEWTPACDIAESEGHYLVTVDMPGVTKENIAIEALEDRLTITGERQDERRRGAFRRSFTLPTGVNADKIEAQYENGVLHVMIPKAEAAQPRRIQIAEKSSSGFFGKFLGKSTKTPEGKSGAEDKNVA